MSKGRGKLTKETSPSRALATDLEAKKQCTNVTTNKFRFLVLMKYFHTVIVSFVYIRDKPKTVMIILLNCECTNVWRVSERLGVESGVRPVPK